MNKKYGYTVFDAMKELAGEPDEEEKQRLLYYYPSYESKKHRKGFLKDVFEYKAHNEIAQNKIKNTQFSSQISKQQVGGHAKWSVAKLRVLVIRFLYLRYVLDEKMTKRKANAAILRDHKIPFVSPDNITSIQVTIREATRFK